ncbi:MAG: stage III sporulation protein AA [Clostridiales bacterium]|nr:stage III sporulation protein AA [Clostridiales bacterium]
MRVKQIIERYFDGTMARIFAGLSEEFLDDVREIRLRVGAPLTLAHKDGEFAVGKTGCLNDGEPFKPEKSQILKCVELMGGYSAYAFEEEIRNGYVTLPGGHRVGMTGKAVVDDGRVKTLRNINSLNVRISHEAKGCADDVMGFIVSDAQVLHTMIISPPGRGKTTLLRDMARQISDGVFGLIEGRSVGIVDERSEIAGCYMGIPQNDVGERTDVLDGCPKKEGMLMLLRGMAPSVVVADEIGGEGDAKAIEEIINGGASIICTTHGASLTEALKRPSMRKLFKKKIFERFIFLKAPGGVKDIYDADMKLITPN